MKLFFDTANIDELKKGMEFGLVEGVTTNPSLVGKEDTSFIPLIKEILNLVPGPVSVEVTAESSDEMIEEAKEYAKLKENVVIKVPIGTEGLKVIKALDSLGIKTNVTLVFSLSQALLAARAGASFVSPFVGRIDDTSWRGMELVRDIRQVFDNYNISTEIIAASVRGPLHFCEAALAGADIATVPFSTVEKLIRHPLTDLGIERFKKDWAKVDK